MKTSTAFLERPDADSSCAEEQALLARILASRLFVKSGLLSRFLRYICEMRWAGSEQALTEQHIGVRVFGRLPGYDCGEDNIVRNYARQLRSRLQDYFEAEGREETLRIGVPRGGYKPIFVPAQSTAAPLIEVGRELVRGSDPGGAVAFGRPDTHTKRFYHLAAVRWLAALSCCLTIALLTVFGALLKMRQHPAQAAASPMHALWSTLFAADRDTVIVTADSGFGTLQDVLGRRLSLAEYMGLRLQLPSLAGTDRYLASDLASQRYTSMVDLETALALSRLPEAARSRLSIRFARDLRMDDLKDNNVVIIGSAYTNPWAELFEKNLNFQYQGDPVAHTWRILNLHPAAGEQKIYEGERDESSHHTYARVVWTPNLNRTGHVLMLQGLDMAGTAAAAQSLLSSSALSAVWGTGNACASADASFESLLSTTSIGSDAGTFVVLATRRNC